MPPNEVPTTGTERKIERIEDFIVDQHQIPEALHLINRVARGLAGAWMVRRVDREAFGQPLDEGVPDRSAGGVQINQRRAAAADPHLGFEIAMADRDGSDIGRSHVLHPTRLRAFARARCASSKEVRAIRQAVAISRSRTGRFRNFFGHQWFSHCLSSQIFCRCGRTSRPNSSMFFLASACGIDPNCSATIR